MKINLIYLIFSFQFQLILAMILNKVKLIILWKMKNSRITEKKLYF